MQDSYDFDPLDVTKTWPEDVFPLQPVSSRRRAARGACWLGCMGAAASCLLLQLASRERCQ